MSQQKEESFLIKYRKEILIGIIAILMLVFIVQNSEEIEFQMIFVRLNISLIFLIALFFALGMLTMWIRFHAVVKDKNKIITDLEKRLKEQKDAAANNNG